MVRHHLFPVVVTLLLALFNTVLSAATLEAHVDKKQLIISEHITLTLALINSDTRLRAQGIDPNIDLTLLTDNFELSIPQASNRYSPFRNRGRSSSEVTVTLFPKRAGELTIPPFTVDGESSKPIIITVLPTSVENRPLAFTRSGAIKSALWLREQTIVYLDLYHRVELKSAKLGGPIESEPKLQIQLNQLPQSDRTEEHNGVSYNVTRTAWAVAPAINQTIHLYLPDAWVETATGEQLRFPFNDITIEAMPLPEEVPPHAIIGKPLLTQSTINHEITQHQSFQLLITLQAATSLINLSPTPPSIQFPAGLKVYSESDTRKIVAGSLDGSSTVTYRYFIMPLQAGAYRIPDVTIPYFDPERSAMSQVTLVGQQFTVISAPLPVAQNTPASEKLPIQTFAENEPTNSALSWQLATFIITLAWLTTALIWWHQHQHHRATKIEFVQSTPSVEDTIHPLQTQLLAAFDTRTLDQGRQQWEALHGVDDAMRATIIQVQQHYYSQQKSDQANEHLQKQVNSLLQKIKKKQIIEDHSDSWRPEAFTAKK
ncbi:MAG: BatD family protein [Gammaproteobacteria bacterium]|nr:BatD family protein [Gammaproteobacteria bacterium]